MYRINPGQENTARNSRSRTSQAEREAEDLEDSIPASAIGPSRSPRKKASKRRRVEEGQYSQASAAAAHTTANPDPFKVPLPRKGNDTSVPNTPQALPSRRGSSVVTPAPRAGQTNEAARAPTNRSAVPAVPMGAPPTTYAAAAALPPAPTAERGLDLLLSAAALSRERSTPTPPLHARGEGLGPRPTTALGATPLAVRGRVPAGVPMVRRSEAGMPGGGGMDARAGGGIPQRGVSRASTPALNFERGDVPQNRGSFINRDASVERAASENFHGARGERPKEASVGPVNAWPPSAADKKGNIMKNLLDRMAKIEFEFSRVKVVAEGVPTMVVESTARDVKVLREDFRMAVVKNIELEGSLAELRAEIEVLKAGMEDLHAVEEGGGENPHRRNNMLSRTIRLMIYDWMNIPRDSAVLPDPLPIDESGTREYWTTNADGKRILRPGWGDAWTPNEIGWARHAAESVQKDGARWNSQAKQEKLAALTIGTIVNAVHVSFSSWVKAYKRTKKPGVDRELVRQKQRRNTRKTQKAIQRAKFRADVPETAGPEWTFLQETIYQSTDESQDDSVNEEEGDPAVDPDTDDEGPISRHSQSQRPERARRGERQNKPVSHKPYVSRPPTYRALGVNETIAKLDAVVRAHTNARARVRGELREKELPTNRKGVKNKIPRAMIDPQWLASHADSDTPLRMEGFEDRNRAHTKDEEDDLYGEMPVEQDGEFWEAPGDLWQIDPQLLGDEEEY